MSNHNSNMHSFDSAIAINRRALKVLGLWSYPNSPEWLNFLVGIQNLCVFGGIFCFLVYPQAMAFAMICGNVSMVIHAGMLGLPFLISGIKLLILRYKKEKLAAIIDTMRADWQVINANEKNVLIKYWRMSYIVTLSGFFGVIFSIITDWVPFALGMPNRAFVNITDIPERTLVYQSVYPFSYIDPYRYRLTVVSQFVGCLCGALSFSTTDVVYGMIILHACSQFEILAIAIENIVTSDNERFQRNMISCIMQHCQLIRFVQSIEEVFSLLLLTLFAVLSLMLCCVSLQLIQTISLHLNFITTIRKSLFYIVFMNYLLFVIFVYCWVSDKIITQSLNIHSAAYGCKWTNLKPKQYIAIQLLLVRSGKPLTITAGGVFPMTLNTFLHILKTTGSYISVLHAVSG